MSFTGSYTEVEPKYVVDTNESQTFRVPKGFRAPGLQPKKCRAPGLQDENFRALGLYIICFRAPGSTVVYNLDK